MILIFKIGLFILSVCLTVPGIAKAVSEKNLADNYLELISPYFTNEFDFGWFIGVGGKKLQYAKKNAVHEKAVIVFVTGRTEYLSKYAEVFYDLKDREFSTFIYDHRGQGSSERLLVDSNKGHVVDFKDYVEDLGMFLKRVVSPQTHSPIFIVSHSMGGTISYLYMRQNPKSIRAAVLCAPMFAINTKPIPQFLSNLLVKSMVLIGSSDKYIFAGGPYNTDKKFAGNDLTHSKVRFDLSKRAVASSSQVALGSPTFGWLEQSFTAIKSIHNDKEVAQPPIMILSGTQDSVVTFSSQQDVCERLPNCQMQRIVGARHELLMEIDAIRAEVLGHIVEFIESFVRE